MRGDGRGEEEEGGGGAARQAGIRSLLVRATP